jgi:hypothetical protein
MAVGISGGANSASALGTQSLRVTQGGMGIEGNSYISGDFGVGGNTITSGTASVGTLNLTAATVTPETISSGNTITIKINGVTYKLLAE